MPIVYNNKDIEDVYYGSTRIRQVYLGSKLIWERRPTLYACGSNSEGQLGLGDSGAGTDRNTPTRISTASNWAHVSCGYGHTAAITTSGQMYSWGWNDLGYLGLGDYNARTVPTRIGASSNWAAVSCGSHHTVAINTSGEMYSWGHNNMGCLGLGESGAGTDRNTPTRIGTASNWAAVSCGSNHSMAINTAGELYAWGRNEYGQLGLGDSGPGTNRTTPTRVGSATNWATVACGNTYTLAINTSGWLYAWGTNQYAQLGLGDSGPGTNRTTPTRVGSATNWAYASCSRNTHSMAINTAGELYSWGWNDYGQLGHGGSGSGTNQDTPTRVGTATNWAAVSCGYGHTVAITTSGELYAWGYNSNSQLGLGDSGAGTNWTTPTRVGSAAHWTTVACGTYYTLAIRN